MIPEAQDRYPEAHEIARSPLVVSGLLRIIVLPAIQFNGESRGDAVEIQNVAGDGHLSAEFETAQAPVAKQ